MTEREYILHRQHTLLIAVCGIIALAVLFTVLATVAEPYLKTEALRNQENVKWK